MDFNYSDNVFVCHHIAVTKAENCVTWFWSRYLKTQGTCGRMQGTYSVNDQNMGTFLYTILYPGYIFVVPDTTKTNSAVLQDVTWDNENTSDTELRNLPNSLLRRNNSVILIKVNKRTVMIEWKQKEKKFINQ